MYHLDEYSTYLYSSCFLLNKLLLKCCCTLSSEVCVYETKIYNLYGGRVKSSAWQSWPFVTPNTSSLHFRAITDQPCLCKGQRGWKRKKLKTWINWIHITFSLWYSEVSEYMQAGILNCFDVWRFEYSIMKCWFLVADLMAIWIPHFFAFSLKSCFFSPSTYLLHAASVNCKSHLGQEHFTHHLFHQTSIVEKCNKVL